MGLLKKAAAQTEKQRIRFGNTHLGAVRGMGQAGTIDFPYIAYRESNLAAALELLSIISVIAGLGLMFVFWDHETGLVGVLLWADGIFAVNRGFAWLAWKLNNVQVRKKIASDAEYAYTFAFKYPEQAHLCAELNASYAANPEAVSPETIMQRLAEEAQSDKKILRVICIAGLSFLFLVLVAAIAFFSWVMRETGGSV